MLKRAGDSLVHKLQGLQMAARESDASRGAEAARRHMLAAREGDRKAFEQIARDYANMVIAVAFGLLGSREEALDCAQDAFVRAWENMRRYNPKWSVATWLRRIATNLALDRLRKRRILTRFPDALEQTAEAQVESPPETVERKERADQVWELLDMLPDKYRLVLVMREIEGMDVSDISRETGVKQATVRWRLHRARKLFRDGWHAVIGEE